MEAGPTPTLAEQVLTAELAYYHQFDDCSPTSPDWSTWQHRARVGHILDCAEKLPFPQHMLEQHGHSLRRYMATHLSLAAWTYWFAHGSLLAPTP